MFWLPLFLTQNAGIKVGSAAYISGLFDLAGLAGALAAGYLSDRQFASRRFPVVSIMLLALSAISLVPCFHAGGVWAAALGCSLLGFMTYGPDTLLIGAATQDASSATNVGAVAGIVDGFGSIGQLVSPLVVSGIVGFFGWPAVFVALSLAAFVPGVILARAHEWEPTPHSLSSVDRLTTFTQTT